MDKPRRELGRSQSAANGSRKVPDSSRSAQRPARREEFAALCADQERRLYVYILALVANRGESEEILQETLLVLWEKFDTFAAGTNFSAWSFAVARLEVLKHRERQSRERRLLSLEAIDAIATDVQAVAGVLDLRHAALAGCLEKLSDRQRTIINQRYQMDASVDALAESLGRSREAVYQILSRIRRSLHDCIDRAIASGTRQ